MNAPDGISVFRLPQYIAEGDGIDITQSGPDNRVMTISATGSSPPSDSLSFISRSAFVTWALTATPTAGVVATDGKVSYLFDAVTIAITDLAGWRPFGADVYPDHFAENTIPGTTDMAVAILAAITFNGTAHLFPASYAVGSTITWANGALIGTIPKGTPRTNIIGLSASIPIGSPILSPNQAIKLFGLRLGYDTLTGAETQGQRVGLGAGAVAASANRGSVIDQVQFDNCGTGVTDYGQGEFSVTWGALEFTNYSYRAVDVYGTTRTGDTWGNVYINDFSASTYTPEGGFCLTGKCSGGSIQQLNVEHTAFTGYPVRIEGMNGLEIATLHLEGIDCSTATTGYLRVNQSNIYIGSLNCINTRMSTDNTSCVSIGQAGYAATLDVQTPKSYLKVGRLHLKGLASPDNGKYPTYPSGRTGVRNIPGFAVFARDSAYTDENYSVEVENYAYQTYNAQSADERYLLHPEIDYTGFLAMDRFAEMGRILNNGENLVQNSCFDRWLLSPVVAGVSSVTETAETWNIRNGNLGSMSVSQVVDNIGGDNTYYARVTVTVAGHLQSFDQDIPFPYEMADQPFLLLFDMKAASTGRVFEQITATLRNDNGSPTTVFTQAISGSNSRMDATTSWKTYWVEFTGWASSGVTLGSGATVRLAFQFNASSADRSPTVSFRKVRLLKTSSARPMRTAFDRMANRPVIARMATTDRLALLTPPDGMLVYDTDLDLFFGRANGAWVSGSSSTTSNVVASIAALRLVTTTTFPGTVADVLAWNAGTIVGGGQFVYVSTDVTSADDTGTIIVDASSRRWYRLFDGAVTPYMFGAQSGVVSDQRAFFNNMHSVINANTAITSADLTGTWYCNGSLTTITRNSFHYYGSGFAKFIRLSNGGLLAFSGTDVTVRNIIIDGGGFTGAPINMTGDRPTLLFCETYNTASIGMAIGAGGGARVDGPIVFFNKAHDTVGKGGISIGNTINGIFGVNGTWNTGAEGMTGDELEKAIVIANYAHDTAGIGGLAMDKAIDCSYLGNLVWNSHSGIASGDNKGDSRYLTVMGNVLIDNDHVGVWFKNKYANVPITNITQANPGVITYVSKAVTGVTNALPCVVTVVAHGISDGDRRIHHNIGGTTALNGVEYCLKKLTANTYALYDTETLEPIDSTAMGAYTAATGTMDHPFKTGDRQRTTGVTGMVEINFVDATGLPVMLAGATTNTTVSLVDEQGNNFDTSAFTAYTANGTTERGGTAHDSAIIGNVVEGNNDYQIHTGWSSPQRAGNNLIIIGNQGLVDGNNFEGTTDHNGLNRNVDFDAALTTVTNNVTGDGTPYTILFDQIYDNAGSYASGIYTVQQDGHHWFETSVAMTNSIALATAGIVEISFYDRFGVLFRTFRGNLTANIGGTEYRAEVRGTLFLPKFTTVKVVVTVSGILLVGDLVNDGTCTFMGGLLH